MAKLTMIRGQMVVEATSQAESDELTKLAYASSTVTVEKASAKRKKADDKADDE